MRSRCLVPFDGQAVPLSLTDVARALRDASLDVLDHGGHLDVSWGEPLSLRVSALAPDDAERQVGLMDRADVSAHCDSCFAIEIHDLDDVLDDANLLIEVQATLEELTGGWTYNEWNGALGREGETIE